MLYILLYSFWPSIQILTYLLPPSFSCGRWKKRFFSIAYLCKWVFPLPSKKLWFSLHLLNARENVKTPQTFSWGIFILRFLPFSPSWYDFYFLHLSNIWSLHLVWPTSICTIHLYLLKWNMIQWKYWEWLFIWSKLQTMKGGAQIG